MSGRTDSKPGVWRGPPILPNAPICLVSFDAPGTLGNFTPYQFATHPCIGDLVILPWAGEGVPQGFARVLDRAIEAAVVYLWVRLLEGSVDQEAVVRSSGLTARQERMIVALRNTPQEP